MLLLLLLLQMRLMSAFAIFLSVFCTIVCWMVVLHTRHRAVYREMGSTSDLFTINGNGCMKRWSKRSCKHTNTPVKIIRSMALYIYREKNLSYCSKLYFRNEVYFSDWWLVVCGRSNYLINRFKSIIIWGFL